MTDHKAIISALSENYNNKSYQSRLARIDFEVIHVPGVTLGIVDYLSRYPTFPAPEPSKYDELFVVKSIEAFHQALSFINSYNSSSKWNQNCISPQEGGPICVSAYWCSLNMSLNVSTNHIAVCK